MKEDLNSNEKNKTLDLVELPCGKKSTIVKWVYKIKMSPTGEVVQQKDRLVVRGFM